MQNTCPMLMDKENPFGGAAMLSPNRGLNRRRKSLGLGSPLSNKKNLKDSPNRSSNRRKSLDGLSPRSAGLSPQSNNRRKSLGLGSPISMNKENALQNSPNRSSNRRKSLDGLSPRSAGLSQWVTPNIINGNNMQQVQNISMTYFFMYILQVASNTHS